MQKNNIYVNLGIVLLLLIAVFKVGAWFGEMRAKQGSLQFEFDKYRDDSHSRLCALEEDRAIRQRRWSWVTKAWALGKRLPVVRWIVN